MGIDYGLGKTNVDTTNGIRFGVISQHDVGPAWYDDADPYYGSPHCPKCRDELAEDIFDGHECECGYIIDEVSEECFGDEPLLYCYKSKEYTAECGDSGDIFITRSPYYTNCSFCSPCAPGAGYLTSDGDDCKAYCFGPDWFDDSPPHDIYRVKNDSLVSKGNNDGNG